MIKFFVLFLVGVTSFVFNFSAHCDEQRHKMIKDKYIGTGVGEKKADEDDAFNMDNHNKDMGNAMGGFLQRMTDRVKSRQQENVKITVKEPSPDEQKQLDRQKRIQEDVQFKNELAEINSRPIVKVRTFVSGAFAHHTSSGNTLELPANEVRDMIELIKNDHQSVSAKEEGHDEILISAFEAELKAGFHTRKDIYPIDEAGAFARFQSIAMSEGTRVANLASKLGQDNTYATVLPLVLFRLYQMQSKGMGIKKNPKAALGYLKECDSVFRNSYLIKKERKDGFQFNSDVRPFLAYCTIAALDEVQNRNGLYSGAKKEKEIARLQGQLLVAFEWGYLKDKIRTDLSVFEFKSVAKLVEPVIVKYAGK